MRARVPTGAGSGGAAESSGLLWGARRPAQPVKMIDRPTTVSRVFRLCNSKIPHLVEVAIPVKLAVRRRYGTKRAEFSHARVRDLTNILRSSM